ncbi:hypothetical protein [Massilia aerilata]|uniref:Uncharacterized protein n=1 Tax=Massilia aerilata TaxID=453817 RepID=A0ABW0S0B4_9BURK
MQTIDTPQQAVSSNVAQSNEKRILARVVLQAWGGRKGDDAIFVEEKIVDVTDAVLLLDHDLVVELEDSTDQTDDIGHGHLDHSGPLEVYVTSSICEFFGVDSVEEITATAFEQARCAVNPKRPEYVRTIVEMEVTAKVLPGGDRNTALDDLSIEVASPSENVIVTRAQRMKPSADRALVLPAADPSLPRFMQLMTLSNAISIDDGALLTDWTRSAWIGEPTNEVLRFAWTDGELDYSVTLTEDGVQTGRFDDKGRFFTTDTEGTVLFVRFFKVESIGPSNLQSLH